MSSEEEEDELMGEQESDEYPPWLQLVLDEDANYYDEVVILQEAGTQSSCNTAGGHWDVVVLHKTHADVDSSDIAVCSR